MIKRAIVIGLDGLIKPWAERLMSEGRLPNIQKLVDEGSYGNHMYVAVPTLTPANWTSLATGAWVGTHGVPQFRVHHTGDPFSKTTNGFSTESCRAEFLWETAAQAGMKTILMKYPGGMPPRGADIVIDGCHIHECVHAMEIPKVFSTFHDIAVPPVTPKPAKDWKNLSAGSPAPMEVDLEFGAIEHREIVEGRRLSDRYGPGKNVMHALIVGKYGRYDRVLLTREKDARDPVASLRAGDWSSWVPVPFPQIKQQGYVLFRLLTLSEDGKDFTLYSTNIMPDTGWAFPEAVGRELTSELGPFLPNIGGCDTNQSFSRLGVHFDDPGETTVLDLCRFQAEWMVNAARHITSSTDWHFLWTQTHIPDNVQHMWMKKADPLSADDPEINKRYAGLIDKSYEILDSYVGGLAELADDDTAVVVVSDHGFVTSGSELPLVELFEENGLLFWKEEEENLVRQAVGATPTKDTHLMEKAFWTERADWSRTLAIPLSENEVYINLEGREPHGIVKPGKHYEEVRTKVIDMLLDYRDPATGERLVNLALRKEECRSLGLWGDRVGDVIFTQTALTGGHGKQLPVADRGLGSIDGFLCMKGPGIKKGYTMERTAWIVDVAPTLAFLMDLPFPKHSEGAVLHQLIEGKGDGR